MRTACCLLALLLAVPATAQKAKRHKPFARIFMGTVLEYRAPKGEDSGLVVLRLTTRSQDKDGKLHDIVKELTFSPHLRDGKLDPKVSKGSRERYPHLPKDLKNGARVEFLADIEPDKHGRYTAFGINANWRIVRVPRGVKVGWEGISLLER